MKYIKVKKFFLQPGAVEKPIKRMKIISTIVIKKLKFDISKKIFESNKTHILWV